MKAEPLKGKLWDGRMTPVYTEGDSHVFLKRDIKSAVEFLKDTIYKVRKINHPISNNDLYELIDEAFEDVKGG